MSPCIYRASVSLVSWRGTFWSSQRVARLTDWNALSCQQVGRLAECTLLPRQLVVRLAG